MKWYQHDSDSFTDAKIRKLIMKHGAEGYAVYFHCLELIACKITDTNITFELEHDAEIIADNLKIKSENNLLAVDKVNNIMKTILELNLFQQINDKICCLQLAKRISSTLIKNPQLKKIKEESKKILENQSQIRLDYIRLDKNINDKDIFYKCDYFYITNDKYKELKEIFPTVDILIELKKSKLWLDDNPNKAKKMIKWNTFISNWLKNSIKYNKQNNDSEKIEEYPDIKRDIYKIYPANDEGF